MPADREAAERARLAAEALARAREDARARGEGLPLPGGGAGHRAAVQRPGEPSPAAGGSPAGPAAGRDPGRRPRRARRDDPEPLRSALGGLLEERGWRDDVALAGVFSRWDQIVGPAVAAHTSPEGISGGVLVVRADSTAWATELQLNFAATLIATVNAELGRGVVHRVKVRGPAPPPQAGRLRVRGGRGPRGDYG